MPDQPFTADDQRQLDAAVARMSSEPWDVDEEDGSLSSCGGSLVADFYVGPDSQEKLDAVGIAALRNAWPRISAQLSADRERIEELAALLEQKDEEIANLKEAFELRHGLSCRGGHYYCEDCMGQGGQDSGPHKAALDAALAVIRSRAKPKEKRDDR